MNFGIGPKKTKKVPKKGKRNFSGRNRTPGITQATPPKSQLSPHAASKT